MSTTPILKDGEANAIQVLAAVMADLTPDARDRVVRWVYDRFHSSPAIDPDTPRTFWLDDLPATGDLIHVDGQDVPVVNVFGDLAGGQLTWSMNVRHPINEGEEGTPRCSTEGAPT